MACIRCLLVVLATWVCVAPAKVAAFESWELYQRFDATRLSWDERRFLQAGLALAGEYNGLLDGDWGARSQQALDAYARHNGVTGAPENWLAVVLALDTQERFDRDGWAQVWFEVLDLSLLVPRWSMTDGSPSRDFVNFEHLSSSLAYSLTIGDARQMLRLHDFTAAQAGGAAPYTVRRNDRYVTSATDRAGVTLYTRSEFTGGIWSTIMLSVGPGDGAYLDAVAGSIARGRAVPILVPAGGTLDRGIASLRAVIAAQPGGADSLAASGTTPSAPPPDGPAATGTGFFVSAAGHVLTNRHVVEGCARVQVDGHDASVLAEDETFDLALLSTGIVPPEFAVFASAPARLNADILVSGYPLQGLLEDLNVTRGSVTAERGLGGDMTRMQISAPVQPGNSGGPVLSAQGTVVGVVVSKLDAGAVQDLTGDIPQNINFAIRGEMAQFFLTGNGVPPITADGVPMAPETLAERAEAITRLVTCD
jgi:serine protease Do